jgi:hypothetical protein
MANWLYDFNVQIGVPGNELPKPLAAELRVVSFFLALARLLAVATSIHAEHRKRASILPIYFHCSFEVCAHLSDLAAVAPGWAGLDCHETPLPSFVKFKVYTGCRGFAVRAASRFADKYSQALKKAAQDCFLLGRQVGI